MKLVTSKKGSETSYIGSETSFIKRYTKIYLSIFLFLFLISIVSAVPTVTTVQQFTNGYVINEPQDNILKINTDYEFNFHVFNITNGIPKYNVIGCLMNVYNQTGESTYSKFINSPSEVFNYEFNVNAENFSSLGAYYYNVQCNSTDLGGYASSILYVTNTGEANPEQNVMLFFFIGFLGILFGLIYVFLYSFGHFLKKDFDFNDLAFNWGVYFALFGLYILHNNYFGDSTINSVLDLLVIIGAFTNLFFPLIFFVMAMIWNSMDSNRRESERI